MADEYDLGKAFAAIENELIASMMRNMRRHRVQEAGESRQWAMWQVEQLKALEKYKHENQKRYGKQFKDINQQVQILIQESKDQGSMDQETEILNEIKNGFRGKKLSKGASAEFFKLNQRKLEALTNATVNDMQKAETAVLRMANDQYRKVIYKAQVYANTGAGTYEKAVDMAARDFLSAGLNCVEYSNGARHTLSDYADMAIRTASKRAYLQGEGEKRQEWGLHLVIMNKRGNPCPKCLPFVGKVMIDDVWSGGSKADGDYPLMSSAISAGLYHPRCKDGHTTYFPGISTPPDDKFNRQELEEIEKQSKREARQQYAARQADKFGRLAEYSLDPENQERYAARKKEWDKIKKTGESVAKDSGSGIMEMTRKNNNSREGFKFISDKTFDDLTISAKKKGAVIVRGTDEAEEHLERLNAAASNVGDVLIFRKDVCISEVLEEVHHFEQNLEKMNDDKGEPLRSILNEIEAKQFLLNNADKYKIPRKEVELTKNQLKSYQKQLEEYTEAVDNHE